MAARASRGPGALLSGRFAGVFVPVSAAVALERKAPSHLRPMLPESR